MSQITAVRAWEAWDSRGNPTVACRVTLATGATGTARVPAGASTGSHEIPEQRDGGTRYRGKGVLGAVASVEGDLGGAITGLDPADTVRIDDTLRGARDDAPHIGGNATLAVSLAAARAAAADAGVSLARFLHPHGPLLLPMPMVNIFSGGAHAGGAVDMQDFLVIPRGAEEITQALEWVWRMRESAAELVAEEGYAGAHLVADEGGIGVRLPSNEAALQILSRVVERCGFTAGEHITFAIDAAASEFAEPDGTYHLAAEGRRLTAGEMIDLYRGWLEKYPITSIEDPLSEDDWENWRHITSELGQRTDLIGDDFFATTHGRLRRGIDERCATSVLIKVNQNGYLSDTARVLTLAQEARYRTVVSARSGETEDSWLADLATGWRGGQIKVGSTHRSERTAKWNRLVELAAFDDARLADPWARTLTTKEESR